jgi:RimJ/RimL family protein N-acetyltransferase
MKRLMLRHAFRFVNSVVLYVSPQNVRSQKAVQKIGGVRVGSRIDPEGQDRLAYCVRAGSI